MANYEHLITQDESPSVPLLCSFEGCPFAQTVRMTLVHKGIRFRHREVQIFNEAATAIAPKPDWFLQLSPKGRVPILVHQGTTLYESFVIDQYLDEVFPEPKLFPIDPIDRAFARIWLTQASITLPKLWYRCLTAKGEELSHSQARLDEFFGEWDEALQERNEGPFLLGNDYSMVDLFFSPFYERFLAASERFEKYKFPNLPHLRAHIEACMGHPTFQATEVDPEWLYNLYRPFAEGEDWLSPENNKSVRDIVE